MGLLRLDELHVHIRLHPFLHSHSSTRRESVSLSTGRSLAEGEKLERNTSNFALLTMRFARKFSPWNPPSHAEGAYPQKCVVEQSRNHVSVMHFDKFLNPWTFQYWKTSFKTEVCSSSNFHTEAVLWIRGVELVDQWTMLRRRSRLEEGRFPTL